MKLKTMLLPTGEFLLIGENLKWNDQLPETLRTLKEAAGAAGFFVTDQDVEIEDAVFDENAVRHESITVADGDESGDTRYCSTYIPQVEFDLPTFEVDGDDTFRLTGKAVSSGWIDMKAPDAAETVFGVRFDREYGPAGQVKGRPGDPDFLSDPDFAQGREPKVETGETTEVVRTGTTEDFGKVLDEPVRELYDHVTGADGITTVTPKYTPKPGDHVRIVTVNGWEDPDAGENAYVGAEGTVVSRYTLSTSDCWLVNIGPGQPHVAASKLELIAPASEGGQ